MQVSISANRYNNVTLRSLEGWKGWSVAKLHVGSWTTAPFLLSYVTTDKVQVTAVYTALLVYLKCLNLLRVLTFEAITSTFYLIIQHHTNHIYIIQIIFRPSGDQSLTISYTFCEEEIIETINIDEGILNGRSYFPSTKLLVKMVLTKFSCCRQRGESMIETGH